MTLGLSSTAARGRRGVQFTVPLHAFATVRCTEADIEGLKWHHAVTTKPDVSGWGVKWTARQGDGAIERRSSCVVLMTFTWSGLWCSFACSWRSVFLWPVWATFSEAKYYPSTVCTWQWCCSVVALSAASVVREIAKRDRSRQLRRTFGRTGAREVKLQRNLECLCIAFPDHSCKAHVWFNNR